MGEGTPCELGAGAAVAFEGDAEGLKVVDDESVGQGDVGVECEHAQHVGFSLHQQGAQSVVGSLANEVGFWIHGLLVQFFRIHIGGRERVQELVGVDNSPWRPRVGGELGDGVESSSGDILIA